MAPSIKFGTDGWRGVIAEDYTFANVRACAQGVADYLNGSGRASGGLVVGHDTRFASESFAVAVAEVAAGNGVPVFLCDSAAPTPVISYAVLEHKAAGAVVITASHNPWSYNGFKYKPEYAGSASPEVVAELERRIGAVQASGVVKRATLEEALQSGLVQHFDPKPAYFQQLGRLVDLDGLRAAGLRVVADAMYGAGSGYFGHLLSGGQTRVVGVRMERNPSFPGINPEPIPPHVRLLEETVVAEHADVGLATDGDADRIGLVDERGNFINQQQVYALLLLYLLEVRRERGPAVRSVTSTVMADRLGQLYGVPVYEVGVGFKYIGPRMMEVDAILGGEESGGFAFRGHIPERDAMVAGLFLLDFKLKMGMPFSGLVSYLQSKVGKFFYDRADIHLDPAKLEQVRGSFSGLKLSELDGSPVVRVSSLDGVKFVAQDGSWVLIRLSGTEPLLRVYTETTAPERVPRMLELGRRAVGA